MTDSDGNVDLSLDNITSGAINLASGGLVGYKNGKLDKGIATNLATEGLGEVTGRNAARKAQFDAQDALTDQQKQLAQAAADAAAKKQRDDTASSNNVAAARSTAAQASAYSGGALKPGTLGGAGSDFLGV